MITIFAGAADTDKATALWDSIYGRATISATVDNAPLSSPANVAGPQTYDWWKPAAMPAALDATLAAAETCDAFAMAGHNLGSSGATLTLKYRVTVGGVLLTLGAVTPADDTPIMCLFPAVSAAVWRFEVSGANAPTVRLARFGKRLVFPATPRPGYVPMNAAAKIDMQAQRSMGGEFIGATIYRQGVEASAELTPVPRTFVDVDMAAFRKSYDAGGTFFWAGGPSTMPSDLAYCWRGDGGELRPAYSTDYWASIKLGLAGYGS